MPTPLSPPSLRSSPPLSHVFSCLADFQWRVDVTISTTSLARVFRPSLLLSLTLSPSSSSSSSTPNPLVVECSVDHFHLIRYEVARALKHVQQLEQHPALHKD